MIGRLLAWPFKALAWLCILLAAFINARPGDTLASYVEREFL